MQKKPGVVAFIPVRGGSKSIPLKNIKLINGRPLVYWVLDSAVQCDLIDRIYVSTDSEEIKNTVELYGSDKIEVIGRTEETATDMATTESAMLEFADNFQFDSIVLIQATSPLLETDDLYKGLELFKNDAIDSVLTVVRQKRFIWEAEGLTGRPVNYNPLTRPMRQNFDGYLVENGAFYITSREALLRTKCRISGNIGLVEMPEHTYFEPDEPMEWIVVENLMKARTGKD